MRIVHALRSGTLWDTLTATGLDEGRNLRADLHIPNIADGRLLPWLERKGTKVVVFDFDQTLGPYHADDISSAVREAYDKITSLYPTVILSNAPLSREAVLKQIAPKSCIVVPAHKKPHPYAYKAAEVLHGGASSEYVMIGDRTLTDIVGANRAGWHTVKVDPLAPKTDPLGIKIARNIEKYVLST